MKAVELRELAIDWLKSAHPDSIIVTELSVADWGAASIDVAAITPTHIVGVEIKGEGDSPARLDRQGITYGMVAREMWLLCAPSLQEKCFARRPRGWGRLELHEGTVRPYNRATKTGDPISMGNGNTRWPSVRDDSRYEPEIVSHQKHQTPWTMCGTLWRDEIYHIARVYQLSCGGRAAHVEPLTEAVRGGLPVTIIHDEMIRALRTRIWRKPVLDLRKSEVDDPGNPASRKKPVRPGAQPELSFAGATS